MCECKYGKNCCINNQTFTHFCAEWDDMLISINDVEIQVCLCFSDYVSWLHELNIH